ncbi:aliphatic sulfonate ABC transporter substrate-binding protein [Tsukamurella soli]|uniref:ABC transporter substrate-binding protein n=1 Tax=Tsukamurella soli TaxID=644556 RepID=A0ABP8JBR5_9ACTN
MSFRPSRLAGAVLAVALATGAAACSSGSSAQSAPLASKDTSHPQWAGYSFVIADNGGDGSQALAKITGAFQGAPYKVSFARFDYGPPLVQAAASGAVDLGFVGDVPPITGAAQEYGFKIVGVTQPLHPEVADENIIVPKGSSIHSIADLRGKRIAVPQGSSAHGLVLGALESVGLKPSDVQIEFLSPAAAASAFNSGKVDAWSIWNPQSALAISNGARVVAAGLPPIDQTADYYLASDKSLNDPVRRAALLDVFKRLAREFDWANKHPDQFAQALVEEEGISLADAKSVLPTQEHKFLPVTAADVAAEQKLSDEFLAAGQITKKVDVASITDNLLPAGFDSSKTS